MFDAPFMPFFLKWFKKPLMRWFDNNDDAFKGKGENVGENIAKGIAIGAKDTSPHARR